MRLRQAGELRGGLDPVSEMEDQAFQLWFNRIEGSRNACTLVRCKHANPHDAAEWCEPLRIPGERNVERDFHYRVLRAQ